MFNDDEDFGFLTGGLGDLDDDGKVDFTEYDSDCYDFEHIYGGNRRSGNYQPQKKNNDEPPKIYCAWGMFGWILALIGCFMPIINTIIYTDGDEIGLGITLTVVLLIAWIFGFLNRAK